MLPCHVCGEHMDRVPRKKKDHLIEILTLGLFKFRRYYCTGCLRTRLVAMTFNKDREIKVEAEKIVFRTKEKAAS